MRKLLRTGEPFIWLTGGALGFSLLMVVVLIGLIALKAMAFFWPNPLARITLRDGGAILGEIHKRESIPAPEHGEAVPAYYRIKVKQGNRDLYGVDFIWLDEASIEKIDYPDAAVVVERREWGNFHGVPVKVVDGPDEPAIGAGPTMAYLGKHLPHALEVHDEAQSIAQLEIGRINKRQEDVRIDLKQLAAKGVTSGPKVEALHARDEELKRQYETLASELTHLRTKISADVVFESADGRSKQVELSNIVRVYQPNVMGLFGKIGFFVSKFWEFVWAEPRESNTEGGVFPAIFGTVVMVLIMSFMVTPFGILAAFYLREYAKQGPIVSTVRIAVNNLAGVPSIVFGVFGLGFFIYGVGGSIDRFFFADRLPTPTFGTGGIFWASLTLALLTVPVVIVATEEGLAQIPTGLREGSLALGATKAETTWRVVLPAVAPSMLTGLILAMARAVGEVAPLMITGVVKLAPTLPINTIPPFIHLDQKFMHLGFHIYDVGFQSPNVDAARPMVYATAFLLIVIVIALNLLAISMRNRLRKRFALSAV